MNRFQLTIILTVLSSYVFGQTLVVTDTKGKRKRKIKIGKVMTVITSADSTADLFNYYTDSTRQQGFYCPDGCFRLASINVENNSFTIAKGSTLTDFKVEDVKLIRYVRARHPHKIYELRVGLATFGVIGIVGRTITIGHSDSNEKKMTDYLIASAMIGVSAMIKSNVPKTYRLIGVEK
jgi:hypothetical protein